MKVIKRNGTTVPFDKLKISDAIIAANNEVDAISEEMCYDLAEEISNMIIEANRDIKVEDIQDLVEEVLVANNIYSLAKAYIRYRYKKEVARGMSADFVSALSSKLEATDVKNDNANMDENSFGGRLGAANSFMTKNYALNYCMSSTAAYNHENNIIYTHDLDQYAIGSHNCLSVPFDKLLKNGFNTRQGDVRGAKRLDTAFQLLAVIFQLQSLNQFGGVSATHLDWTMEPYFKYSFFNHFCDGIKYIEGTKLNSIQLPDKGSSINSLLFTNHLAAYQFALDKTIEELEQAVEAMFHNLNTLQSRSGNQLPFTSINYGTCTSLEGQSIIQALLQGSIKGIGKLHKTPIFPCVIFQSGKGINQRPGDPNYGLFKLALEATSKRLYPNYANIDWSGNVGYDKNDPKTYFSTMGCRTSNGFDVNGLGYQKDGRGNICPVTIILPTLAMMAVEEAESRDDAVKIFMQILEKKIDEAKDQLIERFERICAQSAASAQFMYENCTMEGYKPEEGIRSALKHGTLVIGQLGLAEALQILIQCDHCESAGMELAKDIEQLFKDKCADYKKQYSLNFGVYFTPAESLCYTAMTKFRNKYGIIPNVSDHDFFTNSMHVPVWKSMTPFKKIDIESQLTPYSSAGCITYVELESGVMHNLEALEEIVIYAMEHDIPYFAVNVPNDTCLHCGFTGEFNDECPMCGATDIQQLRRVTGYLTGDYKSAFNFGKQKETEARVKHK